MTPKSIFISADHGLAIVYFLQSDVVPTLLEAGVEVVEMGTASSEADSEAPEFEEVKARARNFAMIP